MHNATIYTLALWPIVEAILGATKEKTRLTDIVRDIRLASRTLVRELGFLNRHLAGTELSPSQVHALLEIERFPETKASDLRHLFRLDKSAVSRLLADLRQRGFIATSPSSEDGRGRTLHLTAKGQRQLEIIHDKANQQFVSALQAIHDAEWQSIAKSLKLFSDALTSTRRQKPSSQSISVRVQRSAKRR